MLDRKTLKKVFALDPEEASQRWESLSPREREVAEKMARGLPNKNIAQIFGISPKTLDIHRLKVKSKLRAKTAAGIATVFYVVQLTQGKRS